MPDADSSVRHVQITVYCDADHVIYVYLDTVDEKYPFFCDECKAKGWENDKREGKYPWYIRTQIVDGEAP